jgi:hypothetical protein
VATWSIGTLPHLEQDLLPARRDPQGQRQSSGGDKRNPSLMDCQVDSLLLPLFSGSRPGVVGRLPSGMNLFFVKAADVVAVQPEDADSFAY